MDSAVGLRKLMLQLPAKWERCIVDLDDSAVTFMEQIVPAIAMLLQVRAACAHITHTYKMHANIAGQTSRY